MDTFNERGKMNEGGELENNEGGKINERGEMNNREIVCGDKIIIIDASLSHLCSFGSMGEVKGDVRSRMGRSLTILSHASVGIGVTGPDATHLRRYS